MLILRSYPASPFGRKVRLAAAMLGLSERIEVVAADTGDPVDSLRRQNPLGKIPTLIDEDGEAIFDSRVIVEYLDFARRGGRERPLSQRFGGADQGADAPGLADGIMDAAILQVYELRYRDPSLRSAKWLDYQADKVARALAAVEIRPPEVSARHIGAIALACALGYLDLRFEGCGAPSIPASSPGSNAFAAGVPLSRRRALAGERRGRK